MTVKPDQDPDAVFRDAARLAALRATGLLDSPAEQDFDRLADLARRVVGAPACLISLVDSDRAFFKSCVGLGEPWATGREAPLSHSLAQRVVAAGAPVVVEDAREHPLLGDSIALRELNMVAYLGTPLTTPEGRILGSFCVVDDRPRKWTAEDVALMRDLSESVMSEIALRATRNMAREREAELRRRNDELEGAIAAAESACLIAEQAVAARRESEARFHTLADAIPQLAWIANADGWITWYNRRWYEYTGTTPEQMEGWGWQSVHDPDALPVVLERWRRSIASGEPFDMIFPLRGADGAFRKFLTRVEPLRNRSGQVTLWFGTNTDVDELTRVEEALRESKQRTLLATEAAEVGIFEWNLATGKIWWDAQMFRIYGMAPTADGFVPAADWTGAVAPEDLIRQNETTQRTIREGGRNEQEFRIRRKDNGELRIIRAVTAVRANPQGQVEWLVGTNLDVTLRRQAEEHIRLLMGEVNHRSRNLLGVVQSIAKLSARHADPEHYASDLSERISSLAACQNLLVAGDWKGIDIAGLTLAQLSSFNALIGRRILLDGGPARLRPSAAQGIGLALHELVTNAAKYGALSNAGGVVRISWGFTSGEKGAMFQMKWLEEGGPPVSAPTRNGFGRKVIVSMVEHAVKGEVVVDYPETGLSWTLLAPVRTTLDIE